MVQQSFVTRRQGYLFRSAAFVALGLVALASSCVRLENGNTAGSTSSASGNSSSGGSTTPSGSTVPSGSSGSGVDPCPAKAAAIAQNLSIQNASTLMAGEPSLCGGGTPNLTNIFNTPGIPGTANGLHFRDGPRGLCLAANLMQGKTGYSTAFPVEAARGATFDYTLEEQIGEAMGDEMVASGHTMLLAPVVNILRHPAWGRAQETYGEDSYLLGHMGTGFTLGVQKYVTACAKHYAANNIEAGRSNDTSVMDEQTLHEIYGRQFEMVVQDGNVAAIMASYNEVQSTDGPDKTAYHSTQSHELLTDMMRTTFGFKGFILTDWWALPGGLASCAASEQFQEQIASAAVNAGLDMELPWNYNFSQLQSDVVGGTLSQTQLTTAAQSILQTQCEFNVLTGNGLVTTSTTTQDPATANILNNGTHIALARQSATEAMVLLKNDNQTLPIPSTVKTIAVIGATVPFTLTATDISNGTLNFATYAMTGGPQTSLTGDLGSSRVYADPKQYVGPLAGITAGAPAGVTVVTGANVAAVMTSNPDFYVVMAGMTPQDEGEDYTGASDRVSFSLDDKNIHVNHSSGPVQDTLIASVAALGKPMVVVLDGGSVIDMPWLSSVPAVVMAWYFGQDGGDALSDLLFGKKNFSGKLPVTWPNPIVGTCTVNPNSCSPSGPCPTCFGDEPLFTVGSGRATPMDYYLGYRYYDHNTIKPLFAFGYGLSYSTYTYATPTLSAATATTGDTVTVTVPVTNAGTMDGDEVSFVFVSYPNTTRTGHSNVKELKGFTRTTIKAGATAMVQIPVRVADLKYWDTPSDKWVFEKGAINLMVGGSSDNLQPSITLTLQ